MELDEIDREIIATLAADARVSMTTLAEAVHVSRASAHSRFKRLVDTGIIRGFTVQTDPVLSGKHTSAYVTISADQTEWQALRDRLTEIPEIRHIALIGGEFDVIALVRAKDNQDLRRVVLGEIQSIPAVQGTRTQLIFDDFETSRP